MGYRLDRYAEAIADAVASELIKSRSLKKLSLVGENFAYLEWQYSASFGKGPNLEGSVDTPKTKIPEPDDREGDAGLAGFNRKYSTELSWRDLLFDLPPQLVFWSLLAALETSLKQAKITRTKDFKMDVGFHDHAVDAVADSLIQGHVDQLPRTGRAALAKLMFHSALWQKRFLKLANAAAPRGDLRALVERGELGKLRLAKKAAIKAIVEGLPRIRNAERKVEVIELLGVLIRAHGDHPGAFSLAVKLLADRNPDVAKAAALLLADLRDPRAIPLLVARLKDERGGGAIRAGAILALGALQAQAAVPALKKIAQSKKDWARKEALKALDQIGVSQTDVVARLKDADREVVISALSGLKKIAAPGAEAAILEMLAKGEKRFRDHWTRIERIAIEVLGELGSPTCIPWLMRYLAVSPIGTEQVVASLLKIGDPRGLAAVKKAFAEMVAKNRGSAVELLAAATRSRHPIVADEARRVVKMQGKDVQWLKKPAQAYLQKLR